MQQCVLHPCQNLAYRKIFAATHGQLAQLVEQRTENPRVRGSIPRLATKILHPRKEIKKNLYKSVVNVVDLTIKSGLPLTSLKTLPI